jgi:hypothetical protein
MFQAVEAPLLKVAAVAGAAVLAAMFAYTPHSHASVQHLRLHAPKRPHAIYATQWERGDISVTLPDGEPRTMVFHKTEQAWGCTWTSTETIVPDGPNRYWYSYDEEKLECDPCAPPSITTPRVGYVEVVGTDR